ncbi:hypothetical protein EUGRSUZ_L02625 [Eucalyptus grandis]|uniref:CRAL-TRIO domain-containing protein n=1 Tax=Eucalyptus grandis TaxID=71139 RepID=A0AAD9T8T4_EUCGR|nr:hypothetical protein EUGRSUZ_L02625 [Eucalyptus grandis]
MALCFSDIRRHTRVNTHRDDSHERTESPELVYAFRFSSFKGQEIGNEKVIAILDLQKLSYKNVDVRGFITGFQFLQAYYPERLAKLFILNMPGFFVSVWRMISRFLEKATLEKIVIVSNEDEREQLFKEIGAEVLPEEYGGQAKLVPIQDVVLPPLDN